jgi:hypothetical protein
MTKSNVIKRDNRSECFYFSLTFFFVDEYRHPLMEDEKMLIHFVVHLLHYRSFRVHVKTLFVEGFVELLQLLVVSKMIGMILLNIHPIWVTIKEK